MRRTKSWANYFSNRNVENKTREEKDNVASFVKNMKPRDLDLICDEISCGLVEKLRRFVFNTLSLSPCSNLIPTSHKTQSKLNRIISTIQGIDYSSQCFIREGDGEHQFVVDERLKLLTWMKELDQSDIADKQLHDTAQEFRRRHPIMTYARDCLRKSNPDYASDDEEKMIAPHYSCQSQSTEQDQSKGERPRCRNHSEAKRASDG